MTDYIQYLDSKPYGLAKPEKHKALDDILWSLTLEHHEKCPEYKRLLEGMQFNTDFPVPYEQLPFLPVRMFKEYELKSIPKDAIVKTLTSSGTTGQQVSRIFLDRETSIQQTRTLTHIVSDFLGTKRLPMIIIDTSAILKDRAMFSARGAGILGFSIFGHDKIYALDENMELNVNALEEFLEKHKGEDIFLFGFTFMIWQHFYKELKRLGIKLDISHGILIHGGGWKKLVQESVDSEQFRKALNDVCGISRVYDYYGMVEQTGTIYMECECGHLHASSFSDVLIRNPEDFSIQPNGQKGLIEVLSILPRSYPGHVLLTEDEGIVLGEDDCPCGRKGKYFQVLGRIKNAEIRGCSDTYADKFGRG